MLPLLNLSDQLTGKLTEMNTLLSDISVAEFNYRSKTYFALIRTKTNELGKRHYITIMNGELERLFYDHNMIIDREAALNSPEEILNTYLSKLNQSVKDALDQLLKQQYEKMN